MKNRYVRYITGFAVLAVLLIIMLCANLILGSVKIPPGTVINVLCGNVSDTTVSNIIFGIRLPRLLAAAVLGGALSVSGFLLQNFFSNPIAGPFVLGISSGAKLVVALVMIFFMSGGIMLNSAALVTAAFIGSMLSMGFILLVSGRVKNMSLLIISGVMTGYICSAITDIAVAFADDSDIVNLHNWSTGSFSGTDWNDVRAASAVTFTALAGAMLISKPMGAYQLGESFAENSGVNIKRFRAALIILSGMLSACVTAFAGPVSFVGVAVPHLARTLFRTSKPVVIIPASFIGGAVFCLGSDLLARTLFAPRELSISSVTAVFGAPVVLIIMLERSRKRSS
ncbi:MAG: iron ABC transporter permease [Oscillospiraceae bacterium]|nr:iron ABC transporter permease [Oscillospiraceae bacterium]